MARRPLQLCRPDVAEIIDELHRKEPPGWRKDRLLVIKLASRGELTSGKIADLAGICVSQVFTLVRSVREQGLESIWEKSGGGRPEGWRKGIPEEVSAEFERKLEANEFTTLTAAQRWLKEARTDLSEHGVTQEQVATQLYWESMTVDLVRQWRKVHVPITMTFGVLALAHIIAVFLFWGWQ